MPVVVSSWSSPTPAHRQALINKVCGLYGLDTADGELAQRALEWLDASINDLNMNIWESLKTWESGLVLVDGQQHVELTTLCYKESQAYLVDSEGHESGPMTFIPWVHFKRQYSQPDRTGQPTIYTVFNLGLDSKVYLWPTPDSSMAEGYTLTVEYYQRIPKVSSISPGGSLEIPPEFEEPILYGAYKRAAIWRGSQSDASMYSGLQAEAYKKLEKMDRMRPDALNRFRLVDSVPRTFTSRVEYIW